jgi:hypothetical protein
MSYQEILLQPDDPGGLERVVLIEISESRTKNRVRSSRNQIEIEIEVISYPCRGEAQVVSAFGIARMRQSHHSHLGELFISAEEGEGPLEEVQGREGTERRRKASWTEW